MKMKKEGVIMHLDHKRLLTMILMPLAALFLFGLAFAGAAVFSRLFPRGRTFVDWHYLYILLLCLGYFFFLKLKVPLEVKATLLSVPVAAILVKIGIETYTNVLLTYLFTSVFAALTLVYLYLRKKHWLYSYAVVFTVVILLINKLSSGEI
jgi:hypothetical protein